MLSPSRVAPLVLVACAFLGGGAPLPDGPPYSPEEALKTFQIADGFQIELFAAEPLVTDPVAMDVDEQGTVYVVEMGGYPLDMSGKGRVVTLRDTDRDGLPDERTVFADGFTFADGVMAWKNGVLVTDAPNVYYLEDTDGDGMADVRRTVLTGFALFNPQHNVNKPTYGLDNWIYLAHGSTWHLSVYDTLFDEKGEAIRFAGQPDAPTLPRNADGRIVRFRPDTYALEEESGDSQYGLDFDTWGRLFLTENTRHIYTQAISARYLRRNPDLLVGDAVDLIADYGYPAEVYPITQNPQHQLLTDVGTITSACGITLYQGGLFPGAFHNAAFIAEPVHNLVHAARVRRAGSSSIASRMYEKREFLASRDSWFRPDFFYVGPDGALYVLDFYRQIIDHPEWLDESVVNSGALDNGADRGRIYRIVPEGAGRPEWTSNLDLRDASEDELVRYLASPNAWWRRTAQRLLVDRKAEAAVPLLVGLAQQGEVPEGRLHALWTLEGMGRLTPDLIEHALEDATAGVRENAVRLAELHLPQAPDLSRALLNMTGDPDPGVRYQLLLTLGYLHTSEAAAAREQLLFRDIEDRWVQIAALTADSVEVESLYLAAANRLSGPETRRTREFFAHLGGLIGAAGPARNGILSSLVTAAASSGDELSWWQEAALEGAVEPLRRNESARSALRAERAALLTALFTHDDPDARARLLDLLEVLGVPHTPAGAAALRNAGAIARNPDENPARRADAVRLLTLADPAAHTSLFRELLGPEEPDPVQQAAVRALGSLPGSDPAAYLLANWSGLHEQAVSEAIDATLRTPERANLLLDAIERGHISPATLGWTRRVRLMSGTDDALRARARKLLSQESERRDLVVARYQTALDRSGDAEQGRQVFLRACAACHRSNGVGATFGPDLGTVRSRDPRAVLTDILIPNRYVVDGFTLYEVETRSGPTVQGLIASQSPTAVTLKRADAPPVTLARTDVESMQALDYSAMPTGLEEQISIQDMADLLAYIKASP